ncbi:MAG TPA: DNA methyltransferase [Gaiellaceae bacterium]|nr:DNA methyltransferase [Gaiellaceae bacterium]
MAPSEDEIRRRLAEFAARWGGYHGSEKSEAQTFLNQLLECYGVDRLAAGARFEERTEGGFMDLFWPGVCIVEMKRPSEAGRLEKHREQALEYWKRSGTPSSPAPRYVALCAFHRFEVWEPGAVYGEPRTVVDLVDLPDNLDVLNFLAGRHPVFEGGGAELTRDAVVLVTDLYQRLRDRQAADLDVLRDFVLQCIWAMFAEDLHMLPSHVFTRVVRELAEDPSRSSADDLGRLFEILATKGPRPEHGLYEGTPYANGSLFTRPARVHLDTEELELLARAAGEFNWRNVQPAIFGGLLQGALGKERQWALGAHYTHEADILKIVLPTVVEPWRERIAECRTVADVERAQNDLMHYVVLDPACGSGNFLYVAYRELRRIEADLRRRASDMRRSAGLREQQTLAVYFPLSNMRGIEIDQFAVQLARVTLWMGQKLAVDELGLDETVLPLTDLSGIVRGDALRLDWPRANAIIGNPPYHGANSVRSMLGDEYVEWLKSEFGVGIKDYCVYWFRKAEDELASGQRAGLVGTNSISQNFGRGASLGYIADNGGVIVNAISTQDWSGEAAVDVSIVNWVQSPKSSPDHYVLDGVAVPGITTALRSTSAADVTLAGRLARNRGRSFEGVKPGGRGFVLTPDEAQRLLAHEEATYSEVVRPYLIGDDIADDPGQQPRRWIIDFATMTLEEAQAYPAALEIVLERVKPVRDTNRRKIRRERWWLFSEPVPAMRKALDGLPRFLASNVQGKRLLFCWCDPRVCASNLTKVFAFDHDFDLGILGSAVHEGWARAQSSTLEDRFRYTPTSAFETFPFPQPSDKEPVAEAARRVIARRSEICLEREIGLTQLYNEVDDGAYQDLRELHVALDEAVATAYGWPASAAHDPQESNRLLLELNREIAAGNVPYDPFR